VTGRKSLVRDTAEDVVFGGGFLSQPCARRSAENDPHLQVTQAARILCSARGENEREIGECDLD
jgi:hypothetical protein